MQEGGDCVPGLRQHGGGPFGLMDIKVVKNIAKKVGVSEAQVLLRWGLQYDFALLPLSQ